MVLNSESTPNEVLNHRSIPASRGVSRVLWTGFDPLGELLALGFGEFAGSSRRGLVSQTGHALEQELVSVITNCLFTESHHLSDFADALPLSQCQECVDTFDQFQGTAGVAFLETAIELFASKRAEL